MENTETMTAAGQPSAKMETLIPAREAARLLHCNPRLVKAYAERGDIPAMRMGNRWMFLPSLLDEWRRKKLLENCDAGKF